MKLHKLVILLVLTGLATLNVASPARASGESPAAQAESLRTALFNAQRSLLAGDTAASEYLAAAEAVIDGEFGRSLAAADPEAAARLRAALAAMTEAVTAGDAPAFAAARAQAWTAVLAASYRIVEQAVQAGDAATAQAWLLVREFRTASRFACPNGDATVALVGFANGEVDGETVQQFLRADLYDTYQAVSTRRCASWRWRMPAALPRAAPSWRRWPAGTLRFWRRPMPSSAAMPRWLRRRLPSASYCRPRWLAATCKLPARPFTARWKVSALRP